MPAYHQTDLALTFDQEFVPRYLGAKADRKGLHPAVRYGVGTGQFSRAGVELSTAPVPDVGSQLGDWVALAKPLPKGIEMAVLAFPVGHGDRTGAECALKPAGAGLDRERGLELSLESRACGTDAPGAG